MTKAASKVSTSKTEHTAFAANASSTEQSVSPQVLPTEASQGTLHELFMQAPAMIVFLRGPNHIFELANPMYRKLIGEQRDIIGKPVKKALPYIEKEFLELLDQVYKTGKPFIASEMPAKIDRTGSGKFEKVYCDFVYQPYKDASGQVQGIFAHGVDVTKQVLARKKAEESQEYFRTSFEQTAVGMAHTSINGEWLRVNQRLCDLLGYTKDELLTKNFFDLTHPDDIPASLEAVHKLTVDKLPTYALEKRYIRKDGSIVWTNLTISPLRAPDGSIKNFISIIENITKRKKAEEALKESEARFKASFDQAAIAMSIVSLDGKWINLNDAYPKMVGYSKAELKNKSFVSLTHPDDAVNDQQAVAQLLEGKAKTHIREKRYIRKDGSIVWGIARTSLVRNEKNEPQYFVTAIQDITKRKQTEEKLRDNEERFRTLAESIPQIVFVASGQGTPLFYNERWYEYTGLPKSPGLADWTSVIHPKDLPVIDKIYKKAKKNTEIFSAEYRIKNRRGDFHWFLGRSVPIKNREGKITLWFGTATDISERKNIEEALKRSEDRFRAMFEQSSLSIQLLSPDGATVQVNKAWEKLWGASLDQLQGYNMLKDKQLVSLGIMPYIKKGFNGKASFIPAVKYEPNKTIENVSEISYRWVQAYIYPIKDKKGAVREVVLVHEDITASKKHEDEMRKANILLKAQQGELQSLNQSKDEFIELASHQLRTPATAIKQMLGLFVDGLQPDISEQHLSILKKAYKSNERQIRIVNSLLKVAQVDSGRIVLRKSDVNIVKLLSDIIEELQDTFESKSQSVDLSQTRTNIFINADRQYMHMALENIISNASKYTHQQGAISISVSQKQKLVKVSIKDNGVGIAKNDINTLYEKFRRIPNDLSDKVGGVGLGLYWANKVVALHNGHIDVESELNKGTTFNIYLPGSKDNA